MAVDDAMANSRSSTLIVFDALDRFSHEWGLIRELTKGLLLTIVGLQSFRSIRAKGFHACGPILPIQSCSASRTVRKSAMTASILHGNPHELYGLLAFELMRHQPAASVLKETCQSP